MLAAQQLYGPDDGRQWSDGTLAMGRRLFRTLPEDADDRQPLESRDGRLVLVADVRLDNRDALIAHFSNAPAAEWRQRSDAAVLLASLERWGEAALDRLAGDFAFALWDARARTLLLARDFRGQRPLHYHRGDGFFAFASMPKGLHALAEIPRAADDQTVAEFVTLIPHTGPRSYFKGIDRVVAAHCVRVSRERVSPRIYWEPARPGSARISVDDAVAGLRHHLDHATQSCLRGAGGAVGTNLSGGFDSASVTATAARLLAPSGGKVVAFTAVPRAGYDGPERRNRFGDEGPHAAATAAMYPNIEHVLIRSSHASPLDDLDRMFFLFERPALNLCNSVWWLAIDRAARERRLSVMLTGARGNMTMSYNGLELLPELLRSGRIVKLWRTAAALVARSGMRWRGALAKTFGPFAPVWLWQLANDTMRGHRQEILKYTAIHPDRLAELEATARERDLDFTYRPWRDGFAMRMWGLRRNDPGNYNKGILAGWGIDQRDPTADKRLVEYCLSLPTEQFLSNGVQRSLARRALADRLPRAVLEERKKGYQAADWHEGLTAARGEVSAELDRIAAHPPAAATLDVGRMKGLVENWPASGWEREDVTQAYRLALLRGVAAGHFVRKASGSNQ